MYTPDQEDERAFADAVYEEVVETFSVDRSKINKVFGFADVSFALHPSVYRATMHVYFNDGRNFSARVRSEGFTRTVERVVHRLTMDVWARHCKKRRIEDPNRPENCLLCAKGKRPAYMPVCPACDGTTKLGLDGESRYPTASEVPEADPSNVRANLKMLVEAVGYIPPANLLNYSSNPGRSSLQQTAYMNMVLGDDWKLIRALVNTYSGRWYKEKFGSWLKALVASGALADGTVRASYGAMTVANDGHDCRSLGEKTIDDWLSRHGIAHEVEPVYPEDATLNPAGLMRADWKVGTYFIEYFGLLQKQEYSAKSKKKIELCNKHGIALIPLVPDDLFRAYP